MHTHGGMDLRCKVFRADQSATLEKAINRFLGELPTLGEIQLEEITQSEGPAGVTVVLWYSLADVEGALDELEEGPDERDDGQDLQKELA